MRGKKYDAGKPRWSLLPWAQLEDVVKVLTFGALKYSDDNWKRVDGMRDRYFSALSRHVYAWWRGERVDPESGLPHLAHAACCILFLMWGDENDNGRGRHCHCNAQHDSTRRKRFRRGGSR